MTATSSSRSDATFIISTTSFLKFSYQDFYGLSVVISEKSGLEVNLDAGVTGLSCLIAI
jgi:hypothetical protein